MSCVMFVANTWIMAECILRDSSSVYVWCCCILHSCIWQRSALGCWLNSVTYNWHHGSWHRARRSRYATWVREASFQFSRKPSIRNYRNDCMTACWQSAALFWLPWSQVLSSKDSCHLRELYCIRCFDDKHWSVRHNFGCKVFSHSVSIVLFILLFILFIYLNQITWVCRTYTLQREWKS